MTIANPFVLTINAVAQSLNKIDVSGSKSIYQKDDGTVKMTISHQSGKKNRRVIRVDFLAFTADPLIATQNVASTESFYFVSETPKSGFSVVQQKQVVDALLAAMTASSGALVTDLLAGVN